jgi:two-component system, NarL family, response regulator NreC
MLVDDDAVVRKSLRDLIDSQDDMQVTGEAGDCTTALRRLQSDKVDVVVAEALLPGMGTSGMLDELRQGGNRVGVIVLTRSERGDDVLRLVQTGAAGYLRKSGPPEQLLHALRSVAGGGHALEPAALEAVLCDYRSRCNHTGQQRKLPLSLREREVLTLVADGLSTKEIATELSLSHKTVEVHRRRIMDKLDLHKVADLVRYAVREGLIDLDSN